MTRFPPNIGVAVEELISENGLTGVTASPKRGLCDARC
jgi:hypothetical protein